MPTPAGSPPKKISDGNFKAESFKDKILNYNKSQVDDVNKTPQSKEGFTSYLLILALSIHACFEGIAIGLQNSRMEIFYMFIAITFHKWVEALSIGINLNKSNIEKDYFLKFIILFSLMTPIGILLGIIFSGFSDLIEAIFLAISAGK
jgi:zinc transporter 1/2/3